MNGDELVFSLVLALYAQQQRCQKQRREAVERGGGGSGNCVRGRGGGDGDDDDGHDGGFSAEDVAAAAVDGAAVCGDWEGEAKALVRKLRDARRVFPSEVSGWVGRWVSTLFFQRGRCMGGREGGSAMYMLCPTGVSKGREGEGGDSGL